MWIKTSYSQWKNLDHFVTIKICEIEGADGFNIFGIESNDQCHFLGRFDSHTEAVEFVEKCGVAILICKDFND